MGNENVIKSHFIFHEPLIFNRSRKTFFIGHEFKNPHENPVNSDTMKKTWLASFYFMALSWVFLFVRVFHGPWSVRWISRGFSCFFHEIFMPYSCYLSVKNPWNLPIKISWKTYEKHVNLPWKILLDFHGFYFYEKLFPLSPGA